MDIPNRAEQDVSSAAKDRNSRLRLSVCDSSENVATETADDVIKQTASNCGNKSQISDSSASLGDHIEVIKVYLESCSQGQDKDQSVTMFNGDVSQIQEVRYCLKTLREQMAARYKNNNQLPASGIRVDVPVSKSLVSSTTVDGAVSESQDLECVRLRELTNYLYAQLQEMEKRHQEEKEALQAENREHLQRLKEQNERVQQAQTEVQVKYQRSEELERLLGSLKLENTSLHKKMAIYEPELQELRQLKDKDDRKRCQQLEKELAVQKEKNHHLDDMLKSQQRKVRHMIEQLQNSRTLIQDRERLIGDLEEKVAFLEAENRELHDQVECSLEDQSHSSKYLEKDAEIVYSKPLTPTSPGNKSLPFIKVIEIKS